MSYFGHHFASNSDIKEIVARHEGRVKPANIQEIYDFGTEFHSGIKEPHKMRPDAISQEEKELIQVMANTFWADRLCRDFMMVSDVRSEHEFYRVNRFDLEGARCKTDNDSRKLQTILELKGLSITTEKAFNECIMHLDYDQGGAWYLDTTTGSTIYKQKLIVGISKKQPDRLFKVLIDRHHPMYKSGMEKIKKGVKIWHAYGLK